ncbi:MAG TPA: low temperature requirement protein A [Pseudolysinimonas sp.]|nr:low temperature requirement protein A [Pseudolysinimonas sp.]
MVGLVFVVSAHGVPADSRRVSNFELLFDLVFVFAFTQVTGIMIRGHEVDHHAALPVLEAITVLGLLWGVWTSYGWFANQARVDRPLLRLGLAIAMVFVFVAALAVPNAFHAAGGDPRSATVFVVCFAAVRVLHGVLFFRAAEGDPGLRRQILITDWSTLPATIAVLIVGALLGGAAQVWIWFGALVIDAVIVAVTSLGGSWRIHSPSHWAERFNLVVMLALGESVVSIGVGVASRPLLWQVVVGAVLAIVGAITLWWLYFHRISRGSEHALAARTGTDRVDAATVGYTYLHYPIVAGIILTATGIELTMQWVASPTPLGWFGAAALAGGASLYQAATVFFWWRLTGTWLWPRLVVATALVPGVVIAAVLPPLAALGIAVTLGIALNLIEARVPLAGGVARGVGLPEPEVGP